MDSRLLPPFSSFSDHHGWNIPVWLFYKVFLLNEIFVDLNPLKHITGFLVGFDIRIPPWKVGMIIPYIGDIV